MPVAGPRLLAVYTTVASRDEALALAQALVGQRLAACAQLQAIDSVYRWQDVVEQGPEVRLMLKTTEDSYPALEAAIQALHGYALPAIHAVPVARAEARYAAWVVDSVSGPAGAPEGAG